LKDLETDEYFPIRVHQKSMIYDTFPQNEATLNIIELPILINRLEIDDSWFKFGQGARYKQFIDWGPFRYIKEYRGVLEKDSEQHLVFVAVLGIYQ
jgi:hypothetical protein